MEINRLQTIIDYNLSEYEAHAFKLALIWEELTKKMFPKEKALAKLPKQGDPRKNTLFKYCWKLLRETRGLLKPEDYRFYIKANLTIIKVNNLHLSPNVLCGDSAWIRWRIWKKLYDKKLLEKSGEKIPLNVEVDPKIIKKMELTKRFLFEKCEGEPSKEKLQTFLDNKSLHLWAGDRISYFYLLLSPWIQVIVPIKLLEKEIGFDSKIYESQITENLKIYFKQEFDYEFNNT